MGYYQPPPPGYGAPPPQPYGMEPPEAGSIKSMINIAGIISLIFGVLFLIVGVLLLLIDIFFIFTAGFLIIAAVIDIIIYMNCKQIIEMVNARQYEQAKSKTFLWMILGFILGGLVIGIIILIAYLKFDPLINIARAQAYGPAPGYGAPAYAPAPPQPAYSAPPPQQRLCMECGLQIQSSFRVCPHCGRQMGP